LNKCDYHHLNHVKEQHKSKKTLWFTLIITLFFTVMEIVGGLLSNSLALLSDSAHMISDVLALGMSMTAIYMATRNPNKKYTFGFLRFEIIASFINGLALAVIALGIFIEGIKRVMNPREVDLQLMLIIASIGLLVNIILTFVLSRSLKEEENLNIKSALWHFLGDLLSSVGIIISAILIYFTGLSILDPLISMIIGGIIFTGGAKIIHESYLILMESVPGKFDLDSVRHDIRTVEGVVDVHEMHLWAVTTDHYSLTAHVFIREDSQPLSTISTINRLLKDKYGLEHSTIQIEHPAINDHGLYGEGMLLKKQAYSS
jgi:cobalt-zinc-cadmium efflux system protein